MTGHRDIHRRMLPGGGGDREEKVNINEKAEALGSSYPFIDDI